jgi:hypothetical protein
MSNEVVIALIGLAGTLITTFGVMWIKQRFDLQNRRIGERENEEKRCERLEIVYAQMVYAARHREMQIQALAGLCDTRPDYVLARIREIAAEPNQIEQWEKYINGNQI